MENRLLEVIKLADLHVMMEVEPLQVVHNTGNMSKHVEFSVNIAQGELGANCLGVGIVEHWI